MNVRIRLIDDKCNPENASGKGDWIDLKSRIDMNISKGDSGVIPLGVCIELPEGFEGHVAPRSSTFKHWGIIQTNSVGVIDNLYCGDNDEWGFPFFATKDTIIERGDRICQFRVTQVQPLIEFEYVSELGNPDRNGFGSTGKA